MERARREAVYASSFVLLLALHLWLLLRAAARGDTAIVVLLAAAVGVFVHRIAHHARRASGREGGRAETPAEERRRILRWSLVIGLLLPIHLWLLAQTAANDFLLTALLAVAVGMMIYRLAVFSRRLAQLRRLDLAGHRGSVRKP
jgi:hypothetical protein